LPLKLPEKQGELSDEDDKTAAEAEGRLLYEPDSFLSPFL